MISLTNESLNIDYIVVDDAHWYKGREVANILGYKNTTRAILDHVRNDDKSKLEDLILNSNMGYHDKKHYISTEMDYSLY